MAQSALSAVFASVQQEIDSTAKVQDSIRDRAKAADTAYRKCFQLASEIHKSSQSQLPQIADSLQQSAEFKQLGSSMADLLEFCRQYSFHKYHHIISLHTQNYLFLIQLLHWLRNSRSDPPSVLTPEDITSSHAIVFENYPVGLSGDHPDATIEEYLHALISLINELGRLGVNSVTAAAAANAGGSNEDYSLPLRIDKFVKDLQAGFMSLNLKNDSLRRRYDSIKYDLKKIEEVVYDLALRGLLPGNPSS